MSWLTPEARTVMSYAQASALWSKVLSPEKGKPITGWLRMYKQDDESFLFEMTNYGKVKLGVLTPDNVFTFVATPETVYGSSQTLVSSIHRWLPFSIMRHRKGLYRVGHTTPIVAECKAKNNGEDKTDSYSSYYAYYKHYTATMREQASYFNGIQFDLNTGQCLNKLPDDKLIEIPEKRKEWRQALSKFKRGVKARVRVHAFDGLINEMWAERDSQNRWDWRQPDWSDGKWLDMLERSIRDNEFPQELLKGIAQTSHTGYYMHTKPTNVDVLKALDKVCNDSSVELRRRFGVFLKEE